MLYISFDITIPSQLNSTTVPQRFIIVEYILSYYYHIFFSLEYRSKCHKLKFPIFLNFRVTFLLFLLLKFPKNGVSSIKFSPFDRSNDHRRKFAFSRVFQVTKCSYPAINYFRPANKHRHSQLVNRRSEKAIIQMQKYLARISTPSPSVISSDRSLRINSISRREEYSTSFALRFLVSSFREKSDTRDTI